MQNQTFEQEVLRLTNQFRADNGLNPLTIDQNLEEAADRHTRNMATQDFFSHTGNDGSAPWDRARSAGYESGTVGENIAAGYRTPQAVVDGWINSPGHRANMLNPNYNEIGLGYYFLENDTGSVNYNAYWTQLFGKGTVSDPAPSPAPTPKSNNSSVIRGTSRADQITGTSKSQRIGGKQGNDVINGKGGNDTIYGDQGADRLLGDSGDDKLFGGSGNDQLLGGTGSDRLVGGDGNDRLQGGWRTRAPEKDILTGGKGSDVFILGNESGTLYDDNNPKWMGKNNYALITDLNISQGDIIQLSAKYDYRLGASPSGVEKGRAIFIDKGPGQQDELIAIVQGANNLNLNSGTFDFV